MKTKHTPGPWYVADGGDVVAAGTVVAILVDTHGSQLRSAEVLSVRGIDSDTRAANARLIAAGPDLLVACVKMRKYLREIIEVTTSPGTLETLRIELGIIDSAIAKATGQGVEL